MIGIYMPAWKSEEYIQESIKSIQNQKFKNWQLIIIDDGSPDNTYENALKIKDSRITVKRNDKHSGLIGKLKNNAIKQLDKDCKYICHVGSDDLIPESCLQVFFDTMELNPNIGAACGSFLAFNNSKKFWKFPHVENDKGFNSKRLLRYMCLYPMRFYRKIAIEKVGLYSETLTSAVDYDLALKLDEITKIIRIENFYSYYYRQHKEQVSTKKRYEQNLNAKKALEDAIKRRGLNIMVENNQPPFILKEKEENFIW